MKRQMSVGEFVKQLAARLHEERVTMPFKNEEPWHLLFYELKKMPTVPGNRPRFFDGLRFDWDGPYPKCQELSEFLHALHWTASVSAGNPRYEAITLASDVAQLWLKRRKDLDQDSLRFVKFAAEKASKAFAQAQRSS